MDIIEEFTPTIAPRVDTKADAQRLFDVLKAGGIAICANTVGYGIFGGSPEAMQKIFDTKQRGGHKRHAMTVDAQGQREIHILDQRRQDMIDCITQDYNLPLGVVAPYRKDHPLMQKVAPELLKASTARGMLGMLVNGGPVHKEVGRLARENLVPVFGSSANLTGTGTKFRYEDIQPEVRAIADIYLDYGLRPFHHYQRSSTGIDFENMRVLRIGSAYELVSDILKRHFGLRLPVDPGREVNASGHLAEFALKEGD
ncbi:Sua5/YciO/YrdC/YwlC family protein [Pararobbsia silviterrae]|uniref:Sua5/YciO/YrdC/YwlC family protein n=1 Tax=Pararobbsia silviterrae TaxID=1792498 RepID=UPI001F0C688E|nr:Sua5/YciO/YrdC/YwlC family protein [Pararobbsia silviterrae]